MDDFKRREFIKLSAMGFAGITLQLHGISAYAQRANGYQGRWNAKGSLNWDAFLERLTQLAKTQHQLPWNQQRYTKQVKRLLLQCDFPAFAHIKKELEGYENNTPDWFESASLHYEVDFQVSLFQFEEEEYIPHHDHPNMTGVINVVSGSILAKNYTLEEQLDATRTTQQEGETVTMKKCILREVGNEIVSSGHVSTLHSQEGNIHSIMPREFTQLVDVFTPAYHQNTNGSWYSVNEKTNYQGKEHLYEAEYPSPRPN